MHCQHCQWLKWQQPLVALTGFQHSITCSHLTHDPYSHVNPRLVSSHPSFVRIILTYCTCQNTSASHHPNPEIPVQITCNTDILWKDSKLKTPHFDKHLTRWHGPPWFCAITAFEVSSAKESASSWVSQMTVSDSLGPDADGFWLLCLGHVGSVLSD